MKKRYNLLAVSFLLAGYLYGEELFEVGDGKDKDPTTYSFYKDSRIRVLVTKQGKEIISSDVAALYGKEFTVYEDGVDVCSVEYTWKKGFGGNHPILLPRYVDLSNLEKVEVEPGYVAIDPATARFKFSKGNVLDREDAKGLKYIARAETPNLTPVLMAKHGNFVYLTHCEETKGVVSVDVSDPHHIKFADSVPMHAYGRGVATKGNYCYVDTIASLQVVDITDPYNMKAVKRYYHNKGEGILCVVGNFLYYGQDDAIRIFDISEPENMTIRNIVPIDGRIAGIAATEDKKTLYAANKDGIGIYSIEGDNLKKKGEIGNTHPNVPKVYPQNRLVVEGNRLYLLDRYGLRIFDISEPTAPKQTSLFEISAHPDAGNSFDVDGHMVYLAMGKRNIKLEEIERGECGIWVVDASDATKPVIATKFLTKCEDPWWGDAGHPYQRTYEHIGIDEVVVENGILYALQNLYGLKTFDVRDVKEPKYLSSVITAGENRDITFIKDKVYSSGVGLHIVDPFPADNPRLIGSRFTGHYCCAGMVFGQIGRNYIMHKGWRDEATRIVDITNPANPEVVNWDAPWNKWQAVTGIWLKDYLYLISRNGLLVYDMSTPINPTMVFPKEDPPKAKRKEDYGGLGYPWCIQARDKYLYLYYTTKGLLEIYDISHPDLPEFAGEWQGEGDDGVINQSIYLKDKWLILPGSHKGQGMRILDISDPGNVKLVNTVRYHDSLFSQKTMNAINECKIVGDLMYVATYAPLQIFDVSRFPEVRYLDTYFDKEYPWSVYALSSDIEIYGKYLYKNTMGSVDILEIPCPSEVPKGKVMVKFAERK